MLILNNFPHSLLLLLFLLLTLIHGHTSTSERTLQNKLVGTGIAHDVQQQRISSQIHTVVGSGNGGSNVLGGLSIIDEISQKYHWKIIELLLKYHWKIIHEKPTLILLNSIKPGLFSMASPIKRAEVASPSARIMVDFLSCFACSTTYLARSASCWAVG